MMKTFHFIGLVGGAGAAGTSLEPDLKRAAKQLAEQMGFGSLSNYTRFLLTQELALARAVFSSTIIDRCYNGLACPVAACL
jgi:hypothetical protein